MGELSGLTLDKLGPDKLLQRARLLTVRVRLMLPCRSTRSFDSALQRLPFLAALATRSARAALAYSYSSASACTRRIGRQMLPRKAQNSDRLIGAWRGWPLLASCNTLANSSKPKQKVLSAGRCCPHRAVINC